MGKSTLTLGASVLPTVLLESGSPPASVKLQAAFVLRDAVQSEPFSSPTHRNLYVCSLSSSRTGLGTKAREGLVGHCFRTLFLGLDRQGQNIGTSCAGIMRHRERAAVSASE